MNTARKLKTDPAVLAGMIELLAKDPRYGHHKGLLIEAAGLIGNELVGPQGVDIEEAARFLGPGVTVSWIRKQVTQKRIPFHQNAPGGSIWFDLRELRAWWDEIRCDPIRPGLGR